MQLYQFPNTSPENIPQQLRDLADAIDAGDHGQAINLAWVMDCGDGNIECAILGRSPEPAASAYYLFGLAKRKLEEMSHG